MLIYHDTQLNAGCERSSPHKPKSPLREARLDIPNNVCIISVELTITTAVSDCTLQSAEVR